MTTREFNRRVKGPAPQALLVRWRARDLVIRRLQELAVLGICVMGTAVLVIRASQALMTSSNWHPVVAMDPYVVHVKPAVPTVIAMAPRPAQPSLVRVAIHPPIYGEAAKRQLEKKKTVALMLLAAAAHKSAASQPRAGAGGSNPQISSDAAPAQVPVPQGVSQPDFNLARANDLAGSAALWIGRELMQAYDAAVGFVSDHMIPDASVVGVVKSALDDFSARLQSLGSSSGLDFNPLGDLSGASMFLVITAFLAALALCLLGPLYLSSRSERASHAHFYRLEGRR